MTIIKGRRRDLFYRECIAKILRSMAYDDNNEAKTHNLKRARRAFRLDRPKLDYPLAQKERATMTEDVSIRQAKSFKL